MGVEDAKEPQYDAITTRFLKEQEEKDKQVNTHMIKTLVGSQSGGSNETYNW